MTPDRIQSASRDYKQILEHNRVRLSDQAARAVNGLIEYLMTVAQIEDKTPLQDAAENVRG